MRAIFDKRMGNLDDPKDASSSKTRSPLFKADKIRPAAADRPGGQRPARQAGGIGADRRGDAREAAAGRPTSCTPTRGTASPARRTSGVQRRRGGVPGQAPRRPRRASCRGRALGCLPALAGAAPGGRRRDRTRGQARPVSPPAPGATGLDYDAGTATGCAGSSKVPLREQPVRSARHRAALAGALAGAQDLRRPNPGEPGFDPRGPSTTCSTCSRTRRARACTSATRGLHGTDIVARCKRMEGFNVLHPMGWDAFGLPAEQYAITDRHAPARDHARRTSPTSAARSSRSASRYDWDREVDTTDPRYYRWTQWIFAQLFERGLAYQAEVPVNWCPALEDRARQRGGDRRPLASAATTRRAPAAAAVDAAHHRLRRRLLDDLDALDWPESIKTHAAQLDRHVARARRSTSRVEGHAGETLDASSPRGPTRCSAPRTGARARAPAASRASRRRRSAPRSTAYVAQPRREVRARAHRPRQGEDRRLHRRLRLQPALNRRSARAHPDLGRRLRARRATAPARSWPCPATTSATASSRETFDLPIVAGRAAAAASGSTDGARFTGDGIARQLAAPSTACRRRGREANDDRAGSRSSGTGKRARRTTGCATGCSRASATGASRSRSCTSRTARVDRACPTTSCRSRCPTMDDFKPTGRRLARRSRARRDWVDDDATRHAARRARRETNTMPQWAGSCWYYLRFMDPRNDARAVLAGGRALLDAGRPLRRRRRARGAAPAVRALLAQGAVRPRPRARPRSRSRSCSTRA